MIVYSLWVIGDREETIEKVTTEMGVEMESEYERCIYECWRDRIKKCYPR
jgi:hypothetical protein